MIENVRQLRVTMQQMERLLRAVEDLRENVLPQNPELFATLVEAPLDDLQRLRSEVDDFVHELQPTA
jgi:ribosomal 50S subunit-associated protein YjgA (DUF615 family)